MNKIEKLIEELCPTGVPFLPISELCTTFSGGFIKKTKQDDDFEYPVYNGGVGPTGYYNEFNSPADSIAISGRGSIGFVNWVSSKFWAGNSCHVVKSNVSKLSNKYLYYYLKYNEQNLIALKNTGSIPALNLGPLISFLIAVPPIAIQNEIVKILDTFSELEKELEKELEARKKQFDYYREVMFSKEFNIMSIKDICVKISSGGTPSRSVLRYFQGEIPWVRTQEVDFNSIHDSEIKITQEAVDKSSAKLVPANTVILAMYGATAGKSAITRIPVTTNQACCNMQLDLNKCLPEYLFHWLMANYEAIKSQGLGTQDNLNAEMVKNLKLPVPSISEQITIIEILDSFYAITKDVSVGIPSEIEARKKQYEYYRDKLLTFKELESA